MRIAVYSTKAYDRRYLSRAAQGNACDLFFLEPRLNETTASLAEGCAGVCAFVNDVLDRAVLERLAALGVRLIALRCAGFNHVDLRGADELGIAVARVPAYSPHAVAEHTVALVLALNRRIHRAYNRVREGNFSLEGLVGFDLVGKTVGVVGTGRIGRIVARIMVGFGCRVLAHDPNPQPQELDPAAAYVSFEELCAESHIITLHCPLTPESRYLIDARRLASMRDGVMLVNTSRGGLVDSRALIAALKSGKLGAVALDVYEEEADVFFEDLSNTVLRDDVLARLLTFPNVLITSHQAFFTHEALQSIAETTIANVLGFAGDGVPPENIVRHAGRTG